MKPIKNFESLPLWEPLMTFVKDIYTITEFFPESEKNGMALKLRDKATNIPILLVSALNSNGGISATTAKIALVETETLLIICKHLDIITETTTEDLQQSIQQLNEQLSSLAAKLDKK